MLTNNSHGGNHNHQSHHQPPAKQHQSKNCAKLKNTYVSSTDIRATNLLTDDSGNNTEENSKNVNKELGREYDDEYDDEDRAFKEIDDLYEYVRSGILPEYLKPATYNETLATASINSRSKIVSQTDVTPSTMPNNSQDHSSPPNQSHLPSSSQEHNHHHHIRNTFHNVNAHHNSLQNQNLVSSVTAVTTTVSGGGNGCVGGGGGGDETRDHSELFDVSTTTNTKKTYKMSQKNSENVSGSSSFRLHKVKG